MDKSQFQKGNEITSKSRFFYFKKYEDEQRKYPLSLLHCLLEYKRKMTNDFVDSLFEEDYNVDEKAIGIVAKDTSVSASLPATTNPILTSSIPTKSMSTGDLNTVIFSMMCPLLTFLSVLDAYNADYYRLSFDDYKSRNVIFGRCREAGGNGSNDSKTVPNPVWKETKTKAKEIEEKFQESVEKRASDWSKVLHGKDCQG